MFYTNTRRGGRFDTWIGWRAQHGACNASTGMRGVFLTSSGPYVRRYHSVEGGGRIRLASGGSPIWRGRLAARWSPDSATAMGGGWRSHRSLVDVSVRWRFGLASPELGGSMTTGRALGIRWLS